MECASILYYLVTLEVCIANLIVQFANNGLFQVTKNLRGLVLDYICFCPSLEYLVCKDVKYFLEAKDTNTLSHNCPYDYLGVIFFVHKIIRGCFVFLLNE